MKKTVSLILAVMMLLGAFSITAFAAGGLKIDGVDIETAGEITGNSSITAGTVTFTAAIDDKPAKLTLNNATITCSGESGFPAIFTPMSLEIELIGNNSVSGAAATQAISASSATISGTGTLIVHGCGSDTCPAFTLNNIKLPEGYKAVGSTSATETDISNMTDVTFVSKYATYMINETRAQTVYIYNPNAASGKSGSTDITLTVAKSLTYDMVIPEDVTNLNAAGIYSVGQAKVANVKNATDNTVISYTAETTDFKCEGKSDIPASYYKDIEGDIEFPTSAVEVYKNSADVQNIPTMYVGISESDFNAAESGTYTATVTFNFSSVELEKVMLSDIMPDSDIENFKNEHDNNLSVDSGNLYAGGKSGISLPLTTMLSPVGDDYTYEDANASWTFHMNNGKFYLVGMYGTESSNLDGYYRLPR